MRVYMLGAGALGSTIGAVLREGGCYVTLVTRNHAHVDAINAVGLRVRTGEGDAATERVVSVPASTTCAGLGPFDVVVVLVKSQATEDAVADAASLVGDDAIFLSLQNGLGNEETIASVVGRDRVVNGMTNVGGRLIGPGHVSSGVAGKQTVIGELDGTVTSRVQAIADAFTRAGLDTVVSDDIAAGTWDKLLTNVATGALSAITRLPYGLLYAVPELEACALEAVTEAMAVARAAGVSLAVADPRVVWIRAAEGLPPDFKASMLQSVESARTTEVDYINGAVVRWGRRVGVPTPVNATLVAAVKGIERSLTDPQPAPDTAPGATVATLEHVAVRVRDIGWHIAFFRDVLGMTVTEVDGDPGSPRQVWTVGGLQLMADPGFAEPEGRLAHLGILCSDVDAASAAAIERGAVQLAQGRGWLRTPDGLGLELLAGVPSASCTCAPTRPARDRPTP